MKEMVGGCCVCSDERGWPDNPLVYCDGHGCNVAVHQACYGIVTVPVGPWFCRKCETHDHKGKARCLLCPSKFGALKETDTGEWAHVVCALYIPEVRFGNVTSMEPIVLRLIPAERYNKTCYICQDLRKPHRATLGACMQCNKSGCKQQFHVTCAQSLGLLCEEAGNYLDNVKYCGYCQHHYGKLKKGGNVKTIPPYKPVSHDSDSSNSSVEKEGEASPMASGNATPTHSKTKGPGRKSSHSSSATSGKSTPVTSKSSGGITTSADKKKYSPHRRGSSTSEVGGSGSKTNTPAPSPQHNAEATPAQNKGSGNSTPGHSAKVAAPPPSPSAKSQEPVGVISSVASATTPSPVSTPTSIAATTSVVQAPQPKPTFQESVITNTEAIEIKQTKKRKAITAANAALAANAANTANSTNTANSANTTHATHSSNTPIDYAIPAQNPAVSPMDTGSQTTMWESKHAKPNEGTAENVDKHIKKARTETEPMATTSHFGSVSHAPPPPPPPPAHSPASQPSPRSETEYYESRKRPVKNVASALESEDESEEEEVPCPPPKKEKKKETVKKAPKEKKSAEAKKKTQRHLLSPMPGPSGMNLMTNIRSPMGGKGEREGPTSLLVSVPLPSTSHGLNLSAHAQVSMADMGGPSHIFHHQQKHTSMDPNVPGHSPHGVPSRSNWGGLNVSYEMQHEPNKPSVSGLSSSKEVAGSMAPLPPAAIRNKKRAAMATSVVSMGNAASAIQTATSQGLAGIRRPPQPTPPPILYETIRDSPPNSPGQERQIPPKIEHRMGVSCTAPHMLGNELNPESGVAARLQEQLSAELVAHAQGASTHDPLIPPPLINKAAPNSSGSGRSSSSGAQSLDQLLERQWEQGSQFLMEQAQHFDIASLLSCLHQLRTENVRLEDHVGSLLQRRDHLLAVNARLAIPLTTVTGGPPEPSRPTRDSGSQVRGPSRPTETITSGAHQLMMREMQQKPS